MKVLNHHISVQLAFVAAMDTVLAIAGFYLGNSLVPAHLLDAVPSRGLLLHLNVLVFTIFVVTGQAAMGLYSGQQRYEVEGVLARTIVGLAIAAIGLSFADFLLEFVGSRSEWLTALLIASVLLCTARILTYKMIDVDMFRRRVLIYGAGHRASRLLELRRRSDQRGFRIVGFVPAERDEHVMDDERVIEDQRSLLDLVRERSATEVVVAVDDRRKDFRIAQLLECKLAGIRVVDLLGFLERETGRVKVDMLSPSWLIFSEGFNRVRRNQFGFRVLDIFACLLLFVLAAPLMALIALAILVSDGPPVLYRQERVGLVGRPFMLYKFRSMRKDAEKEGAVWAASSDERVTPIGRFLRKYRLDEIPQLINVFRGDMSFVGPRPERPQFVAELAQKIPYYHERHCVKPGITGWAQLCYPYGASEKDALAKLEYDMYYVKNRSLVFNLFILLQTVEVVLWQKGSR